MAFYGLNIYCLESIFRKLNLREQIIFVNIYEDFSVHYLWCCKTLHQNLIFNKLKNVEVEMLQVFMKLVSPFVKSLKCVDMVAYVNDIMKMCKSPDVYKLENLIKVSFIKCDLTDESILLLKDLKSLESLNLSYNHRITGKYISDLKNLSELSLLACKDLCPFEFASICHELKKLKKMDIRWCHKIEFEDLHGMIYMCTSLEELSIQCMQFLSYEIITKIPKIKSLAINGFVEVRMELFQSILNNAHRLEALSIAQFKPLSIRAMNFIGRMVHLKKLVIHCDTTDTMLRMISGLPHLELLEFKNCITISNVALNGLIVNRTSLKVVAISNALQIVSNCIYNIISNIQMQTEAREAILMKVHRTSIKRDILSSQVYQKSVEKFKLKFVCSYCATVNDETTEWGSCNCL